MDPSTLNLSSYDPSTFPALPPPAGVLPDFIDPPTRAPAGRIVICVTLSVMLIFVILRAYTRIFMTRLFGIDDYLCLVSAASVTIASAFLLSILGDPLGPHQWNVPLTAITHRYAVNSIVAVCMYAVSSMFTKCTLLAFYLRMFGPKQTARNMAWAGVVVIVIFYVVSLIFLLIQCIPVDKGLPGVDPMKWEERASNNRCGRRSIDVSAAQGIFGAAADLYVLAIPINSVLALNLPKKRKVGVLGIFLTGLLACMCSVVAAYYRWRLRDTNDYTWDSVLLCSLASAELNMGIICSCMPIVFVVFRGSTTSSPWSSLMRYLRTRGRHSAVTDSNEPKDLGFRLSDEGPALPQFQHKISTSPRTLVHETHHSQPLQSVTVRTEVSTYRSLASMDDAYHEQLKRTYLDSYQTNHRTPMGYPSQELYLAGISAVGRAI
ncbi:hypothetical protein KVR01_013008 [Diaporthe batatas]|uniref:uncharacterized protein n=1 Tax=Diaporthe batatas TaxID=748121 RepID=UPI001D057874|nr:uncharacterized protein KVR01_013008 [Diaporthe batatas]KAG8157018.1 hypothetical protein KVR01_013008 [Diaporthe batatas]